MTKLSNIQSDQFVTLRSINFSLSLMDLYIFFFGCSLCLTSLLKKNANSYYQSLLLETILKNLFDSFLKPTPGTPGILSDLSPTIDFAKQKLLG